MKHRFPLLILVVPLLSVLAIPAVASDVRIVRLSLVSGNVQVDRGSGETEPALLNMPVTRNMRVFSDQEDARVEIEFENGGTLRMAGPGEIDFRELSLGDDGGHATLAEIVYGLVYANIALDRNDDFRLEFNGENVFLLESSRLRIWADGSKTLVAVFKGALRLQGHPGLVDVRKGETLTLDQDDDDRYFLAKGTDRFDSDGWDGEREQYIENARNSGEYQKGTYSGMGSHDLSQYGAYSFVPGYGWMWQPFGMDAGWDPYMSGAWSFYPGYGWTFVSGYAWGWTPYHYGSWDYVDGYGWGWRPGSNYHWAPVTPVGHRPPKYHPPIPPTTAGGPTVHVGPRPNPRGPQPPDQPNRGGWGSGFNTGGKTPRTSTGDVGDAITPRRTGTEGRVHLGSGNNGGNHGANNPVPAQPATPPPAAATPAPAPAPAPRASGDSGRGIHPSPAPMRPATPNPPSGSSGGSAPRTPPSGSSGGHYDGGGSRGGGGSHSGGSQSGGSSGSGGGSHGSGSSSSKSESKSK